MVNIVTINGKSYLVDVAYGSNGPYHPIPLIPDIEFEGIYPAIGRLEYKRLPQHTDPKQRAWVLATRQTEEADWHEEYSFVEIEFFPSDFEVMNLSTMTSLKSFFVQTVVATRILLSEQTGKPEGLLILNKDYVKRRVKENSKIIERLETEDERIRALKKYFFIELKPEERRAIHGMPSELKSKGPGPSGLV